MYNDDDTIAAISAGGSQGSISIIRLSGPKTYVWIDRVFRPAGGPPLSARPTKQWVYGYIFDDRGDIDEVIVLLMRAPGSYTCEDMVEIQGHGGRICARRILQQLIAQGARHAEPGEFTRRAFLNGRIDLMQAEAVQDLVLARSDRAAQAALQQLEGALSQQINAVYDRLITVSADLEAALDFSEEEISSGVEKVSVERITLINREIEHVLSGWNEGMLLREGVTVVLAGQPNTGKSTLLNGLLARERAIVSDQPGTTRDTIEEQIILEGIPVTLVDTAGIRTTSCAIEQAGIDRTYHSLKAADRVLLLLDASRPLTADVERSIQLANTDKTLFVVNKCDIQQTDFSAVLSGLSAVEVSLLCTDDIEKVKCKLVELIEADQYTDSPPHAVISERHRTLLSSAQVDIGSAVRLLTSDQGENLLIAASHLKDAIEAIGKVVGRVYYEELLDQVFSRFCVGK